MVISKKLDNNILTIYLEGRLDTTTVPELEKELDDLKDIDGIIFDVEKLEYISSSGLRLILKCKKEVDNTKVINCNSEVFEIFNITGFSEMMEVEKTFREISIDNCDKIGEGFYGIIYRINPETIVKVYKVPDAIDMIRRERELSRKAFVMGIPTAIPYDIVKVGDSYGAVFELLNAESVINLMTNEETLDSFTKRSANLLKEIHQKEIKEGELPSRKDFFVGLLEECKYLLQETTYNKLLELLKSIPDTNTLLHSDFHIKNIMMQNDEMILIDMDSLSVGHPIFEFGAMYATYVAFSCIDKKNTEKFLNLPLDIAAKLFNKTFRYYYNEKTEEEIKDIELKLSIISYLYVLYIRSKYEGLGYGTEKEEVEYCIEYLTEKSIEVDSLKY